jgi:protein TonB
VQNKLNSSSIQQKVLKKPNSLSSLKTLTMKLRSILICILLVIISFSTSAQQESRDSIAATVDASQSKIFEKVDIEASFPGGDMAWKKFLQENLRADVPLKRKAPAGAYTVWIQFVVDTKGKLSDLKPLTNHGYGMEAEILRVLRKSPKWVPAIQSGNPVRAYRKQPVTFVIEETSRRN